MKKTPKTPHPIDFAKEFKSFSYRSKGNHEAAAMFANDKGTWIVTPHSHFFDGKGAQKKARDYFESLRTDCRVTGTRKAHPNSTSKGSSHTLTRDEPLDPENGGKEEGK